ncbi:MAG: cupin domain-containing protein [Candidatus Eiseniibacteriota bacterium]|nr:MAG: cupin domain-containing protein [Candidatus Eisenbacteria bacterium]
MKVVHFRSAERYEPEKDWKRVSLCSQEDVSIEHFVKPPGHVSPLHEHPSAQVLVVLKGKLVARTDKHGEEVLEEGDAVYIPGNQPHTVTNPLQEASVGLDIFIPGRSFDFWLKRKQS